MLSRSFLQAQRGAKRPAPQGGARLQCLVLPSVCEAEGRTLQLTGARFLRVRVERLVRPACVIARPGPLYFSSRSLRSRLMKWEDLPSGLLIKTRCTN